MASKVFRKRSASASEKTSGARHRIAAERAEKLHSIVKRIGDLLCRDDCRERERVADRLPQDDDVRNDALRFESPEMRSQTPESNLHFVGDADRACCAH